MFTNTIIENTMNTNTMITNKYKIIDKIKEGKFGTVFKCQHTRTNELVAIKFEPKDYLVKTLKNEAKVYQYLGKLDGFPQLKFFGTTEDNTYLVMDLLGSSLSEFISYYKAFSLKTVLLLGIQIIQRIQSLHERHLLHRDIKTDNFLFGLGRVTNKLYLVDFGFTKRFNYDGKHIPENRETKLIGSPNFVSLNIHNGIEPSRRDDLESGAYIILNMLFGKLEWFNKKLTDMHLLKYNIINIEEVPVFMKKILYYIRNMQFDETPDYAYITDLMVKEFISNNYTNNGKYDWSK
jgi:serine/threonine protein kinase